MPRVEDQTTFRIAVLPGDGIGVEVTAEAVRVLEALAPWSGVKLDLEEHAAGAGEYLRGGDPLPRGTFDACLKVHAILLGAMGLPDVRWPDGREMTPQIDLRERLDLYAGLRPIRLLHEADTPLKRRKAGEIDLLIVRESTEGLFSARGSRREADGAEARDVMRVTRRGAERVFRAAFREAEKRRRHVTLVDKANVLPSMVFFRSVFDEVAREFPGVRTDRMYVDAAALHLVRSPERFDVLVTENMFGDILSDLGAALIGGMGMAPSADVGNGRAVFQPSHGTAPDIAGKGIANPIAAILSTAMMLEWLGHEETTRAAERVRRAVEAALEDPARRTPDMGGDLTTRRLADEKSSRGSESPMTPDAPRIVDLTLPLEHGMRGVEIETARTLAADGWSARTLRLYSHSGTHMDAPAHFEAGGRTIDEVPLGDCMGPAWVADLPDLAPRTVITVAHLGGIAAKLAPGESLLLRTGWSAHVRDPKLYRDGLPRVGEELARWCVERRVKMLGVEPPSVADVNDLRELTAVHGILLRGGVVIVEGLATLDALEEEKVFFVAAPLKVRGGDGAPCRAFALAGAGAWQRWSPAR